jgi:hypothetical protein
MCCNANTLYDKYNLPRSADIDVKQALRVLKALRVLERCSGITRVSVRHVRMC